MNKFEPLTKTDFEIVTVPLPTEQEIVGEIVIPIPEDAPVMPLHPSLGKPSAQWPYRTLDGQVAFVACRFDPAGERKKILPLTFWRDDLGYSKWLWKAAPAPRLLYNLDKLVMKPVALVVVVEGEKTAEAASQVFTNSVTTTSSSGSQSASKADWTSIAGRNVLIWPDADEAGKKYALDVAKTLSGIGCQVSIVDATALAKMSPDGSMREVPKVGWDADDAISEWKDLQELQKAALKVAKPFEGASFFVSYGSYKMSDAGLIRESSKGKGDSAEAVQEWICAPFEILGASRNPQGKEWGKWLRWKDADKREHTRHILDSLLHADPGALCQSLASDGLKINRDKQRTLANYLSEAEVKGRVTLVNRTGWHEIGGQNIFVLPSETIGPKGAENVILEITDKGGYTSRGKLTDWQAGVGMLAADHYLPILAISTALAGPLLELAGQEGGGLNFYAASSKGKTTILQAAASVWGKGSISSGFLRAWKATGNGLEGAAAASSDTCLILDELGVADARDVAGAVYGLANGSGKTRANRNGDIREPKTWRVLSLSSGEIPLATKLAEDRSRQTRAGQLVRLLDIPADRGLGCGVFDNAGSQDDAGKLADAFKTAAISAYGTAGPEFVRRIINDNLKGETIRLMIAAFVSKELPNGGDGQIKRAAQRLGLIMAAGELATSLGITPWQEGAVRKAAEWVLQEWIDGRGGSEAAEIRQAIETVRLVIQQHGESRFEVIGGSDDARPINNRLGWQKGYGADRVWMIPPEIWKTEICFGLDPKFVARTLGERGMLEEAGDGWQPVKTINGRNTRVYVVTSAIFDGGENNAN